MINSLRTMPRTEKSLEKMNTIQIKTKNKNKPLKREEITYVNKVNLAMSSLSRSRGKIGAHSHRSYRKMPCNELFKTVGKLQEPLLNWVSKQRTKTEGEQIKKDEKTTPRRAKLQINEANYIKIEETLTSIRNKEPRVSLTIEEAEKMLKKDIERRNKIKKYKDNCITESKIGNMSIQAEIAQAANQRLSDLFEKANKQLIQRQENLFIEQQAQFNGTKLLKYINQDSFSFGKEVLKEQFPKNKRVYQTEKIDLQAIPQPVLHTKEKKQVRKDSSKPSRSKFTSQMEDLCDRIPEQRSPVLLQQITPLTSNPSLDLGQTLRDYLSRIPGQLQYLQQIASLPGSLSKVSKILKGAALKRINWRYPCLLCYHFAVFMFHFFLRCYKLGIEQHYLLEQDIAHLIEDGNKFKAAYFTLLKSASKHQSVDDSYANKYHQNLFSFIELIPKQEVLDIIAILTIKPHPLQSKIPFIMHLQYLRKQAHRKTEEFLKQIEPALAVEELPFFAFKLVNGVNIIDGILTSSSVKIFTGCEPKNRCADELLLKAVMEKWH